MGKCSYSQQPAGFLRKQHDPCRDLHTEGIQEMTTLAAQAASAHTFNEAALRNTLQVIAQRSRATEQDIEQALEQGFAQGVTQALTDGIMTQEEAERLRAFRDHLALRDNAADQDAIWDLEQASGQHLMMEARLAAISVHDGNDHLRDLDEAMLEARLGPDQRENPSAGMGNCR